MTPFVLKLARKFSTTYNHGPFPLYCDDLRPTNVIVDSDLNIRGVIDWEYSYAAPAELTYCSPWWLLLTHSDDWTDGDLRDFLEKYLPRHQLFIRALRDEENEVIRRGDLSEDQRLSDGMAQSLGNGHFWFCHAATSSYGFHDIYWKFIDPFHYGEFTPIEDRISLLEQQVQDELANSCSSRCNKHKTGTWMSIGMPTRGLRPKLASELQYLTFPNLLLYSNHEHQSN